MKRVRFAPLGESWEVAEAEQRVLDRWAREGTYRRSLDLRRGGPRFTFYEGPPTANGKPHPGHTLGRTIKDVFPRYKTMQGFYCERRAGWDTHGLPVEVEVAKELGILAGGKAAIEEYGVEAFNRKCLESVFRYKEEWEKLTTRIGFWVDMDDAYATFRKEYVESVWWALQRLFERGLLYRGHKVVWWWPQGGTALSAGEVAEGYRETEDPAIVVKLLLRPEAARSVGIEGPAALLVWTTTPWTLPSNVAAAIDTELSYVAVAQPGQEGLLILAEAARERVLPDSSVIEHYRGSELLGLSYDPPFPGARPYDLTTDRPVEHAWITLRADFIDATTGTGIVHLAPAFGEDDYRLCRDAGVGFVCEVRADGRFVDSFAETDPADGAPLAGRLAKAGDPALIRILRQRGLLVHAETIRHSYPFCPRAEEDPLIQFAREGWFIRTSDRRSEFLANNARIAWRPEHIRDGRFGKFLEGNVDWALSRERYWGTPLPIWVCSVTGRAECIGSFAELAEKPGIGGLDVFDDAKRRAPALDDALRLHKPYIDSVTYRSPFHPEARMVRVPDVIDVWFDAGCMPFAQWGYPHLPGSERRLRESFPADFISEGLDQTRGWFYGLLAISTLLFAEEAPPHPFRNCLVQGMLLGEDGVKLSKRLKNYRDPEELFQRYGADSLRWSLLSKTPPTVSGRFAEKLVEEAQREFLNRWKNVVDFFAIYASLDGFEPEAAPVGSALSSGRKLVAARRESEGRGHYRAPGERSVLDRWLVSELSLTTRTVVDRMNAYDPHAATVAIRDFVEGLANWWVRRSRRRFWSSDWSSEKGDAYWTLYEALLVLSRLSAPFVPFFSEVSFELLACETASVHLSDYPEADPSAIDEVLSDEMGWVRRVVTLGIAARRSSSLKMRQPLREAAVLIHDSDLRGRLSRHADLLADELNVKAVRFPEDAAAFVHYEVKPNFKVLGPRLGGRVKLLAKVLAEIDGVELTRAIEERGSASVVLDGESIALGPEEVEVRLHPRAGYVTSQDRSVVVAIDAEIDEPLRHEGWARDFIRMVQERRKELQLEYNDHVAVRVATDAAELAGALAEHRDSVANETLADALEIEHRALGPVDVPTIDGMRIQIEVERRAQRPG